MSLMNKPLRKLKTWFDRHMAAKSAETDRRVAEWNRDHAPSRQVRRHLTRRYIMRELRTKYPELTRRERRRILWKSHELVKDARGTGRVMDLLPRKVPAQTER